MAKNKKPLLKEGTVRRMMKLANMEALGNGFISEKWTGEKAGAAGAGKDKDDTDYSGKGMRKGDESDTGRGKDFVKEGEQMRGPQSEACKNAANQHEAESYCSSQSMHEEDELESELHATEDELGAEDEIADEEGAELEGEVTITDEEAQDIIDLADKLKGAVGDDGGEEMEAEMPMDIEAEEEISIEEPGSRMYEEELYEAALKGLNIDVIDDKAEQRKALVQEAKKRIYERVVRRLIAESKK
tara:strand:+ start:9109 stop:9840 length:732 start_codon:yes stop_codon:yes gene_type:complete